MLGQRLDDGAQIADRHALGQQALQHPHHDAQRQRLGHQILDQPRRGLGQAVEQLLHFLVTEQFVRVRLDDAAQVRGDHGAGIHHGVAERLRLLALGRLDPDRLHAERRIARLDARRLAEHAARD